VLLRIAVVVAAAARRHGLMVTALEGAG
jgi:hypothetical protein